MKINDIKHLQDFLKYCEDVIEIDKEGTAEEDWFAFIVAKQATAEQLLWDAKETLTIYYQWLRVQQDQQLFHLCTIIHKSLEIENKHYKALLKSIFKVSYTKQIDALNQELKQQYLY